MASDAGCLRTRHALDRPRRPPDRLVRPTLKTDRRARLLSRGARSSTSVARRGRATLETGDVPPVVVDLDSIPDLTAAERYQAVRHRTSYRRTRLEPDVDFTVAVAGFARIPCHPRATVSPEAIATEFLLKLTHCRRTSTGRGITLTCPTAPDVNERRRRRLRDALSGEEGRHGDPSIHRAPRGKRESTSHPSGVTMIVLQWRNVPIPGTSRFGSRENAIPDSSTTSE